MPVLRRRGWVFFVNKRRKLGYSLPDRILHFATVSYALCKRFPEKLSSEVFKHIYEDTITGKLSDERFLI